MGTPTATPPIWLQHDHPEILNADRSSTAYHGPRRNYTYNSPVYRFYAERIVEAMAAHYGPHPAVVGWQIDNELNCEIDEFYSEADHLAYREFLRARLGGLEEVNRALGLVVWSRQYSDWGQVRLEGRNLHGAVNPHSLLWEKRFFSASAVAFARRQVEILRAHVPAAHWITTNGLFGNLSYSDLMDAGLSFLTFDSYPNFAHDLEREPARYAADRLRDRRWGWSLTRTRSASPGFGIMEQQSGAHGWTSRMMGPAPRPGQMRLWTLQSVAHGADFVSYFRWRTAPVGQEIYWHGLNDYSNEPGRKMEEVARIGAETVPLLHEIAGARYRAEVAVVRTDDNTYDAELDAWHARLEGPSDNAVFTAAQLTHTPLDFLTITPRTGAEDLSRYRLLIAPHLAMMDERLSGLLRSYVEGGGVLVMGARTGYKDAEGHCPMRPAPGLVGQWAGVKALDVTFLAHEDAGLTARWGQEEVAVPVLSEVLAPRADDVEVLARFSSNYYAGEPALTRRRLGRGSVYYLGAGFSEEMVRRLLAETGVAAPLDRLIDAPQEVELALREKEGPDGGRWLFVLNYEREPQRVRLVQPCTEVLTGAVEEGEVELEPYGVRVYRV